RCVGAQHARQTAGLAGAAQIAVTRAGACARMEDGKVVCMTTGRPTDVSVPEAIDLVAGGDQTCIRAKDGGVWCWAGGPDCKRARVVGIDGATQIAVKGRRGCATFADRSVKCWGPVEWALSGFKGVTQVAVGGEHACAIVDDGGVMCWGRNAEGQLGDGT